MSAPDVLIVGGGVSGLSAAFYLGRLGIRSLLIEKSRLGGLIRTDLVEGCRLEAGPDSYISTKPAAGELADDLGELGRQIISSNDAARLIFIVRGGKLLPLPKGMVMMVPGEWAPALRSGLFSLPTKLQMLTEVFAAPRERSADISVGEFVGEHFGSEMLEYVTEPLLSGVYGGNSARLSARSVLPRFLAYEREMGSLIKGVRRERRDAPPGGLFRSFRDGMQSLTDHLACALPPWGQVLYGTAQAVEQDTSGWRVKVDEQWLGAHHLILACPAHEAARLLSSAAIDAAHELAQIPYSSAILVSLLFRAAGFGRELDGFGFLVPPAERTTIAAATWINTKFPTRIAPGWVAMRAFVVGAEAERLARLADSELILRVREDFGRLMQIAAEPQAARVQRWPDSMPQYVVGHQARMQRLDDTLAERPALHLVGNAFDGVGIPDCIRLAKAAAEHISFQLRQSADF